MKNITLKQFLSDPEILLHDAAAGEYSTVRFEDGSAAVMIDEAEWTILLQALKLCMEHAEWIAAK